MISQIKQNQNINYNNKKKAAAEQAAIICNRQKLPNRKK